MTRLLIKHNTWKNLIINWFILLEFAKFLCILLHKFILSYLPNILSYIDQNSYVFHCFPNLTMFQTFVVSIVFQTLTCWQIILMFMLTLRNCIYINLTEVKHKCSRLNTMLHKLSCTKQTNLVALNSKFLWYITGRMVHSLIRLGAVADFDRHLILKN